MGNDTILTWNSDPYFYPFSSSVANERPIITALNQAHYLGCHANADPSFPDLLVPVIDPIRHDLAGGTGTDLHDAQPGIHLGG